MLLIIFAQIEISLIVHWLLFEIRIHFFVY
jgi:hypothetical protein